MRNRWKAVAALVAAGVVGNGAAASAQNVTYSTSGVFSGALATAAGCVNGTNVVPSACTGGSSGFTLTYLPVALSPNNIPNIPGAYVPLGNFFLKGSGAMVSVPSGSPLLFSIVINQTLP